MCIHWPCELNDDELTLLGQLSAGLGYLGRSESWVEAQLVGDNSRAWNAEPCQEGERHRGRGWEQVSLMAAIPQEEYGVWRQQQMEAVLKSFEGQKITASRKKKQDKAEAPYPPDLLACLTKDTVWWKGQGWSQPPGSRRVLYWRQIDSLQVGVPARHKTQHSKPVTAMLLSLTTPNGNLASLPSCTRTLPQAELFHRALICRAANGERINCPSLTGRDDQGKPLHGYHRHAHTIPLDLDGNQHIDHILIHASGALCEIAQRAIRSLRRTWTKGGVGDIQVALVGYWNENEELMQEILRQLPRR